MEDNKSKQSELSDKVEEGIKSIDPTTIGGLDSSANINIDDEVMGWAKSRGKKDK